MGLFTGFSVISSIELLYWIWFKVIHLEPVRIISTHLWAQVIFHKKDDASPKDNKEELGWRERRSQSSDDVEITDVNDNEEKVSSCLISLRLHFFCLPVINN